MNESVKPEYENGGYCTKMVMLCELMWLDAAFVAFFDVTYIKSVLVADIKQWF